MHPDLQRRGCHAPAEADKSQDNCDTCVGYCAAGEAMGSADNTAHYRCVYGVWRYQPLGMPLGWRAPGQKGARGVFHIQDSDIYRLWVAGLFRGQQGMHVWTQPR